MGWLKMILQALPFIIKMIGVAEEVMKDEPKSGEKKKELVMETTKIVIEGAKELSTGGQKETWEKIEKPIGSIIDAASGFMFKK